MAETLNDDWWEGAAVDHNSAAEGEIIAPKLAISESERAKADDGQPAAKRANRQKQRQKKAVSEFSSSPVQRVSSIHYVYGAQAKYIVKQKALLSAMVSSAEAAAAALTTFLEKSKLTINLLPG